MGDRRMPSLNPILTRIALAKNKAICKRRLRSIKATVDTKCPKSLEKGRRRNRKKEQMDEDRFSHIERENRLLLTRMSRIMLRDNMDMKGDRSHVKSLNLPHRKREVKRINATNRLILERIEKTRPYCMSL